MEVGDVRVFRLDLPKAKMAMGSWPRRKAKGFRPGASPLVPIFDVFGKDGVTGRVAILAF